MPTCAILLHLTAITKLKFCLPHIISTGLICNDHCVGRLLSSVSPLVKWTSMVASTHSDDNNKSDDCGRNQENEQERDANYEPYIYSSIRLGSWKGIIKLWFTVVSVVIIVCLLLCRDQIIIMQSLIFKGFNFEISQMQILPGYALDVRVNIGVLFAVSWSDCENWKLDPSNICNIVHM